MCSMWSFPPPVGVLFLHTYTVVCCTCTLVIGQVFWSCPQDCMDPFCKNRCLHCHCMQTFQLQLVCRIVRGWSAGLCLLTQVSWLVIKRGPDTLACQTVCWCTSLFLLHFVCYNKSFTLTVKTSNFWHENAVSTTVAKLLLTCLKEVYIEAQLSHSVIFSNYLCNDQQAKQQQQKRRQR